MLIIMFGKFWTKLSGYRKYQEAILCTSERERPTNHEARSTRATANEKQPCITAGFRYKQSRNPTLDKRYL